MHDNLPLKHVSHETFCVNVNYADVYCCNCSVIVVQCMTNCIGSLKLCHAWEATLQYPCMCVPLTEQMWMCDLHKCLYCSVQCRGSPSLCEHMQGYCSVASRNKFSCMTSFNEPISLHVFTERGATPQLSWQEVWSSISWTHVCSAVRIPSHQLESAILDQEIVVTNQWHRSMVYN